MTDTEQAVANLTKQIVSAIYGNEDGPLMTVRQFCERNSISRSHFYALLKRGEGPKVITIGLRGMRVSRSAELEWRAARQK
jgi:excisionase family DNA binding protein